MKKLKILLITIFIPIVGFSQFTDDFSDGDYTNNPQWTGEDSKFQINASNELQLFDTTESGNAYLSTPSQAINSAEWEFLVRFDFDPSSSNYANIFLISDKSSLNSPLKGYFVKIGNTDDEISLYKKTGSTETEIIDGTDDRVNMNDVVVRVRVIRDNNGNWDLYSDTTGGTNFYQEGSVKDEEHESGFYFGVECVFTKTRKDNFFFDDFEVTGNPYQDTIKPELNMTEVVDSLTLRLSFSEPLDSSTAINTSNYQINNGIGVPADASFENGDRSKVILTLNSPLQPNYAYRLEYENIDDLYGNKIDSGYMDFTNVIVYENDIVINELMPDPTDSVNLPEKEFLELYNTRDIAVNLKDWYLIIGDEVKKFSSVSIPGDDYLILCDNNNINAFQPYGLTVSFSSFNLLNDGEKVKILNSDSVLVNEISYTKEWYHDDKKDNGGWSLEKIDPWNNCGGESNWSASINPDGGTPGSRNSIFGQNQDNFPPELVSWELASANGIKIKFSEIPAESVALNSGNYSVSPDKGEPDLVSYDENNNKIVRLQYASSFEKRVLYTLTISNIEDKCGNKMPEDTITFINYPAKTFDVLITEIMANPSPVVYLPEAEYIELYNNSPYKINLSDWILMAGSSDCSLPAIEIPSGEYIALTDKDDFQAFSEINNVYGVSSMPSLPNSSGDLQLISKEGEQIHFVNYASEWYRNSVKADGGWSLEMIDTDNYCGENNNWKASESEKGGTPGEKNSVADDNPDNTVPGIKRAIIQKSDSLLVMFNEALHPDFTPDSLKFSVDNGFGNPAYVGFYQDSKRSLVLAFNKSFQKSTIYTLDISDTVTDCAGNKTTEKIEIEFALSDSVESGDIVINEVLFNPLDGGEDFVELYNRSDKFVDLYDLRIASRDDSLMINSPEIITNFGFLVFPGEYAVISESVLSVQRDYYCKNPDQLLKVENLPSYPNSEGDVVLCLPNFEVIDDISYNEEMHFSLLKSYDGVSLERINYEKSSADKDNWHSASEASGYGTPTYQNSQFMEKKDSESKFKLTPESISPDNDGYQDVLTINYNMGKPGYVLSIDVYDASGQHVKELKDNELLGAKGSFTWDGLDKNGQHPGRGIYILLMEYYDLEGKVHQEKKTVVIAVKK